MSSVYTPTATEHGSYVIPSDGDPAVAESVNQSLRDLADSALNANNVADAAAAIAAQAVNGVTGGTYAPADPIIIGGDGLQVDGAFAHRDGTATFESTSTVALQGTTNVTGALTATAAVNLTGTTSITNLTATNADITTLGVLGFAAIGSSAADALQVLSTSTFNAPVTFDSTIEVTGVSTFAGNAAFNRSVQLGNNVSDDIDVQGAMTLQQRLRTTGNGRVPWRYFALPDADASVTVADGNAFRVPAVTANRSYSLSTTSAAAGDCMVFFTTANNTIGSLVTINSPTFGEDTTFSNGANSQFAFYVFDGSDWLMVARD